TVAAVGATACRGGATSMSAGTNQAVATAATRAEVIFEGTITAVAPSPGVWSGRFAAYQAVSYQVTHVIADREQRLKGDGKVTVQHLLVTNSATADKTPRLNP